MPFAEEQKNRKFIHFAAVLSLFSSKEGHKYRHFEDAFSSLMTPVAAVIARRQSTHWHKLCSTPGVESDTYTLHRRSVEGRLVTSQRPPRGFAFHFGGAAGSLGHSNELVTVLSQRTLVSRVDAVRGLGLPLPFLVPESFSKASLC